MFNKVHKKIDWGLVSSLVGTFGPDKQLNQIQEELSELITAISHYRRSRVGSSRELAKEGADVIFMLAQLFYITGWHDMLKNLDKSQEKAKKILPHDA